MRHRFMQFRIVTLLLATSISSVRGQAPGASAPRDASTHRVAGTVSDEGGSPVAYADIRLTAIDGSLQAVQTDGLGHFAFAAVPAGVAQLEIRRLGFHPLSRSMSVPAADGRDSARIVLGTLVARIAGVEISDDAPELDAALGGFYSRKQSNNFGHYLDRAALEVTHAQRPSEALRSVPGVMLLPSQRIGNIVRFRNCRPTIWLDGIRLADAELDEVTSLENLAAVEIYKSLAGLPQQFVDRTNPCGGILIWSRNH
jgi:hypothetical protein